MLSLVTPAFNEAANLQALYDRVTGTMATLGDEWEWIVVDDHSADGTFTRIRDLAARDARVRGLRLARNSGSHMAITAGLHHAHIHDSICCRTRTHAGTRGTSTHRNPRIYKT